MPQNPESVKYNFVEAIFSDSTEAEIRRTNCGAEWSPRTLTEIREKGHDKNGPIVRVLADGIYDVFHWGHAAQFRQIKQLIPNSYLIVGVCTDEDTTKNKRKPVFDENERVECVRQCRYVDEVYKRFPYSSSLEIMHENRIDIIAHDSIPYIITGQTQDSYQPFKDADRFLETQRAKNVSTTDVIKRILDRSDAYQKRVGA